MNPLDLMIDFECGRIKCTFCKQQLAQSDEYVHVHHLFAHAECLERKQKADHQAETAERQRKLDRMAQRRADALQEARDEQAAAGQLDLFSEGRR